jgi:hypothetical protein
MDCHDLKDRTLVDRWPEAAFERAAAGASLSSLIVIAYCHELAQGADVQSCGTPEAKIACAQGYAMALDLAGAA